MEHDNLPHYGRVERPWGCFEQFTLNDQSTVKIIVVREGDAFSLQTHARRDEFWRIIAGRGVVTIGEVSREAQEGDEFFIPKETLHRANGGVGGLTVLEISFGEFDENDIVRLEDKYGRTS